MAKIVEVEETEAQQALEEITAALKGAGLLIQTATDRISTISSFVAGAQCKNAVCDPECNICEQGGRP